MVSTVDCWTGRAVAGVGGFESNVESVLTTIDVQLNGKN